MRSRPARSTTGFSVVPPTSMRTLNSPVGCSTESVFTLPGLGRLAITSVLDADLPVITATVLVAGFFIVVANIVVDLLYAVIDPRVRLS